MYVKPGFAACLSFVILLFLYSEVIPQAGDITLGYKGDAQVEVGSHFVGIELHHSSPSIQRISFYYPVANSIDLSTDYWKRDTSFVMSMGLRVGDGKREQVGLGAYQFQINPYSVSFHHEDQIKSIEVSYRFANTKPAMIITYTITNNGNKPQSFEFDTHLATSVRTSHTYKLKEKAWTEFDKTGYAIFTNYDDPETGNVQIFTANAGEMPVSYYTRSNTRIFEDLAWFSNNIDVSQRLIPRDTPARAAAKFLYRKILPPKGKMTVVQIVGSCRQSEGRDIVGKLLTNYRTEIRDYENYVQNYARKTGRFKSGDNWLDRAYLWAKAILAVNQHYIDGTINPMPCPAEYNFYFSHDVFLTDLAAVNFDLKRVKKDLEFTVKHADKDSIIPHAYYWKDSAYVTEYATPDNWNHFWFIILSASYLRHSSDTLLLQKLYPYITKSLTQAMSNSREDIMWAYRPDWWDIGHNFGPRAFMTIMAVKSLRDYVYLSSRLNRNTGELTVYSAQANRMQEQLNSRLWDDSLKYLINYFEDGSEDKHYYIGSLPAATFNQLSPERTREMVETAEKKLLDRKLGIYTVYPMDFNKLIDYLKFAGNEAGDPFLYINGGIWSHGNTFYALALKSAGRTGDAIDFVRRVMTVDGIMNGPNGQPAMYEYRNGNYNNPDVYGKVDKPQFMWAAGWYIYSLYHLFGIDENDWNIRFTPFLKDGQKSCAFTLEASGKTYAVNISGKGKFIRKVSYGGREFPSAVIPAGNAGEGRIDVTLGRPLSPYLNKTDAALVSCVNKAKELTITLSAAAGHINKTEIISPFPPRAIMLNGKKLEKGWNSEKTDDLYIIRCDFIHVNGNDELRVEF